ncbi:MAG: hypothetical protein AB8G22_24090 [Saprospiraceae bacterium]
MQRLFKLSLMIFALLLAFQVDVDAQYGRKKKKKKKKPSTETTDDYFDESGDITARLWYGGSIGNIGLFNGSFSAGLSPMVGYKITNNLSAGVITKFDYFYQRRRDLFEGKIETLDFSIGGFARYRIIPAIFAHVEYESTSFQLPFSASANSVEYVREWEPYFYIGAGYQSGNGPFGYEISIYYNVLDDATYNRVPWDLRIGFNYNF